MSRYTKGQLLFDEQNVELMKESLFDLAASEIPSHRDSAELQEAVRAVLVDGMRVGDAAEKYGVPQPNISRRAARIQQQLEVIAERHGWVLGTFLLPSDVTELLDKFEAKTIEPLRNKQLEKVAKKNAKSKAAPKKKSR